MYMRQYQPGGDAQPIPDNYGGQIFTPPPPFEEAPPPPPPPPCEKKEKGWLDKLLSRFGIGKWINSDTLVLIAAVLLLSDDKGDDDLMLILLLLFCVR